jgi:hypothetical protein
MLWIVTHVNVEMRRGFHHWETARVTTRASKFYTAKASLRYTRLEREILKILHCRYRKCLAFCTLADSKTMTLDEAIKGVAAPLVRSYFML